MARTDRMVRGKMLTMAARHPPAVLDRPLDPVSRGLTPGRARRLINLRADPAARGRIDDLAGRCNAGQLAAEGRSEYETYVSVVAFIGPLRAKARRLLAAGPSSAITS